MNANQIENLYAIFLKHPVISTDTRSIAPGSLFFALKGERFNGNHFALKALESGAAYAVIDEPDAPFQMPTPAHKATNTSPLAHPQHAQLIVVPDVLLALQALATHHRKALGTKVFALTGSNGKTTTKELIYSVLSTHYNALATAGNLNNHIGVPLTLLKLRPEHEIAIVEMGANHQGEIAQLCQIAQPDIGMITNIGKAHLEGFGGPQGVIKGKSEMYKYLASVPNKTVLVNTDNPILNQLTHEIFGQAANSLTANTSSSNAGAHSNDNSARNVPTNLNPIAANPSNRALASHPTRPIEIITYGTQAPAQVLGAFVAAEPTLQLKWLNPLAVQPFSSNPANALTPKSAAQREIDTQRAKATANYTSDATLENPATILTQIAGAYNLENVLAAIALGLYLQVPPHKIIAGIQNYQPNNSRSEWVKKGRFNVLLDAYNANPTSMAAAVQNFIHLSGSQKWLILGDMFELGADSPQEHLQIIQQISMHPNNLSTVMLVGPHFCEAYHSFLQKRQPTGEAQTPPTADAENSTAIAGIHTFQSTALASAWLKPILSKLTTPAASNYSLLIKGSRGMQLETLLPIFEW